MKMSLRKQMCKITQWTLCGFVLQWFFAGLLFARESSAQEKSIYEVHVKANFQEKKLGQVLSILEKKTGFNFTYHNASVDLNHPIVIEANQFDNLGDLLAEISRQTGIQFSRINKNIHLSKLAEGNVTVIEDKKEIEQVSVAVQITGTVTSSEDGQPLVGVSVLVKGTNTGTTTDINGKYTINANEGNVLQFRYVGYQSQEITVGAQTIIDVVMQPNVSQLNEIVVVGYGTQAKRDVTGSISRVTGDQIRQFPITSADQALQGRTAGVQVFQTNGAPGGAVQVRVRGINSTSGGGANQPLYVIDGIPLANYNENLFALGFGIEGTTGAPQSNAQSPLNTISPADIESIEVLKDASATAIYGARAANGVVLITTKTGKGASRIELNSSFGIQSLRREIPMLNARERMLVISEHRRNQGTFGSDEIDVFSANPFLHDAGTNWQREIFRQAPMSNTNLSISGAANKVSYMVSADYMAQDGIILNTYSNRASFRTNLDVTATNWLKVGTRTALSYQTDNMPKADAGFGGLALALTLPPTMTVRDANGNFQGRYNTLVRGEIFGAAGFANLPTFNYVAELLEEERRANRYRMISSVFAEVNLLPNLSFRSVFGVDYMFGELRNFTPIWQRGIDRNPAMSVLETRPRTFGWVADQYLTYDKKFGVHSLNVVAGISAQKNTDRFISVSATGSTSNSLNLIGNQPTYVGLPSGGEVNSSIASQFIRANYSYKDKYLFTGTVRRDGSSRFGPNYKYGFFPSASAGWRISEENFMKDITFIDDLKLRASYGITGNQNIGDFLYAGLVGGNTAVFGDALTAGVASFRFDNFDIQWEKNKQLDVGFELSVLKGRLNFTADYYFKRTDGLLASFPISAISGVGTSVIRNVGVIDNRGIEFSVNGILVDKNDFRWSFDFNIATNHNEVVSLGALPWINGVNIARISSWVNRTQPGQPIGAFYVLQRDGMYTSWEEAARAAAFRAGNNILFFVPGDFRLVDKNSDGIIDDNDRSFVGSPFPDYFGGMGTNLSYKNFSLNIQTAYQHGNLILNYPRLIGALGEVNMYREEFENRYRVRQPSVQTSTSLLRVGKPITPSDEFLEDGSFFRIRSISLAYDFPSKLIQHLRVSRLRMYAQANNFFVFTRYKGWDPEVNSFGSNVLTNGIDFGAYPQAKSVVLGINLGL
jgi:TonB-linked SusC/RagA family outer membrane protein